MELILNLVWALLAATVLVCWSLKHWRTNDTFGRRLLALAVLLCIVFPAVSISDDLWSLHNPAETDILLRRNDSAMHHQDTQPHRLMPILVVAFALPAVIVLGRAAVPQQECLYHKAPASFTLTIRPPPVL